MASILQNVKIELVNTNDIIMEHWNIVKKSKKLKVFWLNSLTKDCLKSQRDKY